MFDLSSKFNTFYSNHVVLSGVEQKNLNEKKKINIDRLEDGLIEYNNEKKTNYQFVDDIVQGSMAMSTVTQNDKNEYDIDVAIIFDKENIPEGTTAVKNIVEDALRRKCKQFNTEPEALTNAVRVEYADGYHIDFAVYRRYKNFWDVYEYEHCGSQWRRRDPRAITNWFNSKNATTDGKIRTVVRLLKMFCKSRSGWLMPGGLIQSALVEECIQEKERIDETFYYTIKAIRDRLQFNKEVYNPVDASISLLMTNKDVQKVSNLYSRLITYINKLDVLFKDNCTAVQAISAWNDFFNHSYWAAFITESAENRAVTKSFTTSPYMVLVDAMVEWKPNAKIPLRNIGGRLPKGKTVYFKATPNFKDFDVITWEVQNTGDECGTDTNHIQTGNYIHETTRYRGTHTMTCRVYRKGTELCRQQIKVNIR
ncbi:cyclic GMP-AMP synthase DncV-like nucleotidyltransferase [Neobacillus cucumis]|uniref:cyclic GMP-AMP synthase DncV-like nucleotidyltransferase n=1 Tax=Neobacillus cucumis TaxID=1740721 RepID=UPI0019651432|nr:nucleotidyltransferase [Neobacillus cucumis]MBM7651751.1 hypothetical protein [Neobacillus cucumis]